MIAWLRQLEADDYLYFLGLALLGVGLARAVSVETACSVVGGVLIVQSTIKAYFLTWLSFTRKN